MSSTNLPIYIKLQVDEMLAHLQVLCLGISETIRTEALAPPYFLSPQSYSSPPNTFYVDFNYIHVVFIYSPSSWIK